MCFDAKKATLGHNLMSYGECWLRDNFVIKTAKARYCVREEKQIRPK